MAAVKEVMVSRKGYKPVKLKIKIVDNNIYFDVKGEVMFLDICHYLLEKTTILELKYQRSAPYKLEKIKNKTKEKFTHKTYNLKFLLLKDEQLEEQTNHIIDLHTVNTKVKGSFNCFIPDLFLVMEDLGYIKSDDRVNYKTARKFSVQVSFERRELSPVHLENQGYIVPDKYKMAIAAIE